MCLWVIVGNDRGVEKEEMILLLLCFPGVTSVTSSRPRLPKEINGFQKKDARCDYRLCARTQTNCVKERERAVISLNLYLSLRCDGMTAGFL